MLTDGDVIRNLLGTYCRLVDAGDFAGIGRLMADARVCDESGTVLASGSEQIAGLYRSLTRRYDDGTPLTQHVLTNTILEPVDDERVVARSSYLVLQATPDLPLQPIITGSYVDTFVRTNGADRWRFEERRFGLGRTGDVTQHLTIPLEQR